MLHGVTLQKGWRQPQRAMEKLHFPSVSLEPMSSHLDAPPRVAHQTSLNQIPIGKRGIKTIFNHFRDKAARYRWTSSRRHPRPYPTNKPTRNPETTRKSSDFLNSCSFQKENEASPPGIEPGTPGFLRGFRLKARCSVLTELRALYGPCLSFL